MATAQALVVPRVGAPFELRRVELDSLQPSEVLVELAATGICHTDLAVQHGHVPMAFPAILGHEGAGVVRAVGREVTAYEVGDHVILSYNFCGECRSCRAEKTYQCSTAQKQNFGGSRADGTSPIVAQSGRISACFFGQSSFCNPTIVQEASCVKIDQTLPLEIVCALGCGFQTGAGAVYNVVKPLERGIRHVAVFGIGGVGCAAIMAANHLLSSLGEPSFNIVAIDVNRSRLELARELGATHVINSGDRTIKEAVLELTEGEGLDAAIDCTGALGVVNDMIALVGQGGIAVTVGGPSPGAKAAVDVFDMLIRCKSYTGCHQGNAYAKKFIPWLADLYKRGHFPLEKLQKTYAAADINIACDDMAKGKVIKPVLLWRYQGGLSEVFERCHC